MAPEAPDESWKDVLMGAVDQTIATRKESKPAYRDIRARVRPRHMPLIVRAAAQRKISLASYARRAILAFVAYDLMLDHAELLADEPPQRLAGAQPGKDVEEAGRGHGLWEIERLI